MTSLNTNGVKYNNQNAAGDVAYCDHTDPCIHNGPRAQEESSKIVVHGARITCSMAEASKSNTRLTVKDGYGYIQGGKLCAHDQSCIPVENIPFFSGCISYDVEKVLTALYDKASSAMKIRYDEALKAAKANQPSRGRVSVPCTLPLLDRWFDADEKEIVTKSLQVGSELDYKLRTLKNNLSIILSNAKQKTLLISENYEFVYSDTQLAEYVEIGKKLNEIKEKIETRVLNFLKTFNTKIQLEGENFEEIVAQLQSAKNFIKEIGLYWDTAHELYSNLPEYETYAALLGKTTDGGEGWEDGEYNEEIDKIIEEIREWKEDELHLILEDSFLVCRCGGIITFLDSGQDFCKTADNLEASILKLVTRFKEHCQGPEIKMPDKQQTYEINASIKAAAKGLEKFENLLLGKENSLEIESCVYMELICKSYFVEVKKARMSILSLLSLMPGMNLLSLAIAIYTIKTMEENLQGAVDGISANISSFEAIAQISEQGANAIVQFNNAYTLLSSIVNLYYVSYDTQIEGIRITVFTENYAHILDRKVTSTGELDDGIDIFQIHTKADYESLNIGRGLRWKDKPGVYLDRLVHNKGEDRNDGEEYKQNKVTDI